MNTILLVLTFLSGALLCKGYHVTMNATDLAKAKKQQGGCCRNRNPCPTYQFLYNAWRQNMGTGQQNRDCDALFQSGTTTSGVQTIAVRGNSLEVYCQMNTHGHNWIRIQHRTSNTQSFAEGWTSYQSGFGDLANNFWLGLNAIHQLSYHLRCPVLRIDMMGAGGAAYAEYSIFRVGSVQRQYRLRIGGYTGNAGDGMSYHNGAPFSTMDNDNDQDHFGRSCSMLYGGGGWWYRDCYTSNLNGIYGANDMTGMTWYFWQSNFQSLTQVTMLLRNGRTANGP